MTNFFEHQRIARQKSRRVLLVFALFMFFLLYVFNYFVYLIFGMSHWVNSDSSSVQYAVYSSPIETSTDYNYLQKLLWIHPETAQIQWWIMGFFLLLFLGGFMFRLLQYQMRPEAVVQSMVFKQVFFHSNITEPEVRLLNIVEEMSISAGIPIVKTFVLPKEQSINAFTAGHDLRTAHIVVTQGALEQLSRDEMQAVIAHEIGHIVSADVRVNALLLSCIFSMTFIMNAGLRVIRHSGRANSSSNSRSGGGGAGQVMLLALVLICIGALGAFCGRILQSMFSRRREFLADSLAAQFTRNPSALASALAKIRDYQYITFNNFMAADISHMCFVSSIHRGFLTLFATHPPVDDRIKVLDPQFLDVHPEAKEHFKKDSEDQKSKRSKKKSIDVIHPLYGASLAAQRVGAVDGFDPYLSFLDAEKQMGRLKNTELDKVLHEPQDFKYAVWAFFIAKDEAVYNKQLQIFNKHYGDGFSEAKLKAARLNDEAAVDLANSIFSIALSRVRVLSAPDKERFLTTLQEIIHADGEVCPFEHITYACFMAQNLTTSKELRIQLEQVRGLLFLCAELNESSEQNGVGRVQEAYQKALSRYLGSSHSSLGEPRALEIGETASLLCQLRAKSLQNRQEILFAIRIALWADGKVSFKEFEAFRALAIALDIPAPPFSL